MTDKELDKYGKRVLAPLRPVPHIDPEISAQEKAKFLLHGEQLRQGLLQPTSRTVTENHATKAAHRKLPLPLFKALVAILIALVILIGSSISVYAAQNSLPGEPLYTIKSLSEDMRLSMTFSTKARLDLTLDYTNRRMGEIRRLLAGGKAVPEQTSERFQRELESALELAAQLDDSQMQLSLGQIKHLAESQGITIEDLITMLPPQAEPAIIHLQERLHEQVKLSTYGENDPQGFRSEMRERKHKQKNSDSPSISTPSKDTSVDHPATPVPDQDGNGNGNGIKQATDAPGHGNQGGGQGKSTPGNGNH